MLAPLLLAALAAPSVAIAAAPAPAAEADSDSCPDFPEAQTCIGPQNPAEHLAQATDPSVYNRILRPQCGNSTHRRPQVVEVQLYLNQLYGIDEKAGQANLGGYLRLWWKDRRLAFKDIAHGGCFDSVQLDGTDANAIWKPDVFVPNLVKSHASEGSAKLSHISADGTVWQSEQILMTVRAQFDLGTLPYDSHKVGVSVASYAHDISEVRMKPRGGRVGSKASGSGLVVPLLRSTIWKFPAVEEGEELRIPGRVVTLDSFDYVHLELTIQRKTQYYMDQYFLPAILFSLLAYCQFFVDAAAAPARAALAIMPVLIMRTLLNAVYNKLPEGSQNMWLSDFLQASQWLVSFSAFQLALVQYCVVLERRRTKRLQSVKSVKGTAEKLVKQHQEEGITLLELLKRYAPEQTQVHLCDVAKKDTERVQADLRLAGAKKSRVASQAPKGAAQPVVHVDAAEDNGDGMTSRMVQSQAGQAHDVREADLLIIVYARDVYLTFDADHNSLLSPSEFQAALTSFNIYMSQAQAAVVMAMFLRDSGESTPLDERCCALSFSQFTRLLLAIDSYDLAHCSCRNVFGIREFMRSKSLAQRCDIIGRVLYPLLLSLQILVFCAGRGLWQGQHNSEVS